MNVQGRPTRPETAAALGARNFHWESRVGHGGGADLRDRAHRCDRRRYRRAGAVSVEAGSARAHKRDRFARTDGTGGGPSLRAAVAQQLLDRRRNLPARLVHDEAQSPPQRKDGAPAWIRRCASAAAGLGGAGGARSYRSPGQRLVDDDRHGRGRDVAEGRRARRTLRHDDDQGGDRGARGGSDPARRAGSRFRPRHEPRDRGADRIFGAFRACGRGRNRRRRSGARRARARRCGDHADQSQHLRPVRARDRRHRRRGARGGSVFLLRRREFQRHRRQDASGRPRRRRHAHQPAQDILDPAWRRRPGGGAGRAVVAARAFCAGSLRRARGRDASARRA